MFRCCIGGEPRGATSSGGANAAGRAKNKKNSKQSEVFFDMPKPEGQLSSVTDQANSTDHKRRKESREKEPSRPIPAPPKKAPQHAPSALDAPDNNGLSRGQNFMKVEKWLREANKQVQVTISPGNIANLEDHMPASGDADVPSERDRLPQSAPRR